MGYVKKITYGKFVELYEYEKNINTTSRKSRVLQSESFTKSLGLTEQDLQRQKKQKQETRQNNARRSALVFRRLISANLGESTHPILASFTYAENITSIGQAHKDFKAFIRRAYNVFATKFRYIAVAEFQKRGSLHFHALIWDVSALELTKTERRTRLVAGLWGKGFVDLTPTDGDLKIAGYLSKYMSKAFTDPRLWHKKSYIASMNIKRPIVERNIMTLPLFSDMLDNNLSTAEVLQDKSFNTQWLGKGRFRLFNCLQQ